MRYWVLVDFTFDGRRYAKGEAVELPQNVITASLVTYGVISTIKPDGVIT